MEATLEVPLQMLEEVEAPASDIDRAKCIICQVDKFPKSKFTLYKATREGIDRIQHCAKLRESLEDLQESTIHLTEISDDTGDVLWHRSCYSNFTNQTNLTRLQKRKSEVKSNQEDGPASKRRSSLNPMDWSKCMFCQGNSQNLNQVQTKETSDGIIERVSFKSVWTCYAQKLQSTCELDHPLCYRSNRFKEKVQDFLGDKVLFIQPLSPNESPLIIPSNLGQAVVQSLLQNPPSHGIDDNIFCPNAAEDVDLDAELLSWLFRVSVKIHHDIKETESLTSLGDINIDSAEKVVPESLYMLIRLLCAGDLNGDNDENFNIDVKNRILSICQDIVFLASKGRKLTPKHVGLGLTIHQATRSKDLIQLLHSAGHTVGYDTLIRLDKTIADDVLQRYHDNGNVFVPSNFKECTGSTYMRYAADNIDINEETLSGLGTFHATQITALRTTEEDEPKASIQIATNRNRDLKIPSDLHELQEASMTTDKPEPVMQGSVENQWYDPDKNLIDESVKKDLLWVLSRLQQATPELQQVPGWSGFNQMFDRSNQKPTIVGPLPIINATAHEYDTLWTVILRCLAMTKLIKGTYTVITLDEALYCKAKMLQWSKSSECKSLVLMLGGFHTQMGFSKVIGKLMLSSGLSDIWCESEVLGENTALNALQGKVWNRVIRAHKLTYEALWRILWPLIIQWSKKNGTTLDGSLNDHTDKLIEAVSQHDHDDDGYTFNDLMDKMTPITDIIQAFDSSYKESATIQYWRTYMNMISILLRFTRALREGNWRLFLSSFSEMLPWFAVFDHVNYTRWGMIFLADMKLLPQTAPEVYRAFEKGDFVTKESQNKFNKIPDDQALEHVNRAGKVAGGLVGITRSDTARDRWCLTYNDRARLTEDTKAMFNINKEEEIDHKDSNASRIRRDEEYILKLVNTFHKYDVFRQTSDLVVITTGDIATDEIKEDLLQAQATGQCLIKTFIQQRLINKEEKFHTSIKQQKLKTLENLYTVSVKVDKMKTVALKAERDLFRRIIVALESGRSIEVDVLLQQEWAPVPLSLATLDRRLRFPSSKADLSHILQKDSTQSHLPVNKNETCTIIDGMAAIQSIGNRCGAKTFGEWSNNFLKYVLTWYSPECTRTDIVFDRYQDNSIKEGRL